MHKYAFFLKKKGKKIILSPTVKTTIHKRRGTSMAVITLTTYLWMDATKW